MEPVAEDETKPKYDPETQSLIDGNILIYKLTIQSKHELYLFLIYINF